MEYKVIIKSSAQRDLDKLPNKEVSRIIRRISQLKNNPRPVGVQKLTDKEGYRIRTGNYRFLFEIDDKNKEVSVYRIKHRKEAYK